MPLEEMGSCLMLVHAARLLCPFTLLSTHFPNTLLAHFCRNAPYLILQGCTSPTNSHPKEVLYFFRERDEVVKQESLIEGPYYLEFRRIERNQTTFRHLPKQQSSRSKLHPHG